MKKTISILLFALLLCTGAILGGCSSNYTFNYEKEDLGSYIKLGQYEGFALTAAAVDEVTEATVQAAIDEFLATYAEPVAFSDTDTAAEKDTLYINYAGTMDGVAFEGGTSESETGTPLTLGSGSMIAGFEDALVGAKVGDVVTFDVTFPADYDNKELAGKPAQFKVTVISATRDQYPTLDDAFIAENTEDKYKTVAEYTDSVRTNLETTRAPTLKKNEYASLWKAIMDNVTVVKYPEKLVESNAKTSETYYKAVAVNKSGMSLSDFVKKNFNSTMKDFRADLAEQAQAVIKEDFTFRQIVAAGGYVLSDEEYEAGIADYMTHYGVDTKDKLIEQLGNDENYLKQSILFDKVLADLSTKSTFTYTAAAK